MIIELPDSLEVTGARKLSGKLDLTKLDTATACRILDYWFGAVTIRASASIDAFADKVEAEIAMAKKLESFDWASSGGGGGARLTLRDQAEREELETMFIEQGVKKSEAEKRARAKDAWRDITRLALARSLNRSDISDKEINDALAENKDSIDEMVRERLEVLEEIEARKATLKRSKLKRSKLTFLKG